MKFLTTYQDLNNRLVELENIKTNSNTLYLLIAGRVESFYKQNAFDIKQLKDGVSNLFDKHVEKNDTTEIAEKGVYKFQKITGEINGVPHEQTHPVYIDAEHDAQYKKEYDALMKTQFMLII